jgi:hypothetical protein
MKPIGITDLLPQPIKFKIQGREFAFRPADIQDNAWIQSDFGHKELKIADGNVEDIRIFCQIAFKLLVDEYKPLFNKQIKTILYNEKTKETHERDLEPWEVFMKICTMKDMPVMATALAKAMGAGEISLEELEKYGTEAIKKKNKSTKGTGQKSLT